MILEFGEQWTPDFKFPKLYTIKCLVCGEIFDISTLSGCQHVCNCGSTYYIEALCRIVLLVDGTVQPDKDSTYTVEMTY